MSTTEGMSEEGSGDIVGELVGRAVLANTIGIESKTSFRRGEPVVVEGHEIQSEGINSLDWNFSRPGLSSSFRRNPKKLESLLLTPRLASTISCKRSLSSTNSAILLSVGSFCS